MKGIMVYIYLYPSIHIYTVKPLYKKPLYKKNLFIRNLLYNKYKK